MIGGRRSQRERDASAQSAHVAERASRAIDGPEVSSRSVRTRRLSEGVAVEASVVARLLRWRILTLDASVLLLPAGTQPAHGRAVTPPPDAWSRRAATRASLSDAIRDLDHAEDGLARARRG